jgi:hypothetical protein
VAAVLRACLAPRVAQRAGLELRVADPARLVEKVELQPASVRPVVAIPDGLRPAAERAREVVLHPAVRSVPEVLLPQAAERARAVAPWQAAKPEGRLAPERLEVATLDERRPVAERVPAVVLPQAAARVQAASPRQAAKRDEQLREAAAQQAVAEPDERPLAAVEPDEQPREAVAAPLAWGEARQQVASQAEPRLASRAQRPVRVQHALPSRAAAVQLRRSQFRLWRPGSRS